MAALTAAGGNEFISDLSNILQKIIDPTIKELLPTKVIFFNALRTNSGVTPMANNTFYVTLRSQRHSGVTSPVEGATLVSGKPSYDQATVASKWSFGAFTITDQALEAAKGDPGSLANYLIEQTDRLRIDFAREMNREFYYGLGDRTATGASSIFNANVLAQFSITASGVFTTVGNSTGSGAGGASGTLLNWGGLSSTGAETVISPTKWLMPYGPIQFIASGNFSAGTFSAAGATGTVSTGAITNNSFVLSGTGVSLSASGVYYITRIDGDGNLVNEPSGLRFLIDDGTTADVTTYPVVDNASAEGIARTQTYWQSKVATAASATLNSVLTTTYLKAKEFGDPKFIMMNQLLYSAYGNSLLGLKRTYDLTEDLLVGWEGVQFAAGAGNVGVLLDYECPDETIFGIDPDAMTLAEMTPISWLDYGQNNLLRYLNNASWQGVLKWYGNLAIKDPRSCFKIIKATTAS